MKTLFSFVLFRNHSLDVANTLASSSSPLFPKSGCGTDRAAATIVCVGAWVREWVGACVRASERVC